METFVIFAKSMRASKSRFLEGILYWQYTTDKTNATYLGSSSKCVLEDDRLGPCHHHSRRCEVGHLAILATELDKRFCLWVSACKDVYWPRRENERLETQLLVYWVAFQKASHKTSIPALAFAVAISFFIWWLKSFSSLCCLLSSDLWNLQSQISIHWHYISYLHTY